MGLADNSHTLGRRDDNKHACALKTLLLEASVSNIGVVGWGWRCQEWDGLTARRSLCQSEQNAHSQTLAPLKSTLGCFMVPVRTALVSITAAKLICKGKHVSLLLRKGNTGGMEVESDYLHPIAAL